MNLNKELERIKIVDELIDEFNKTFWVLIKGYENYMINICGHIKNVSTGKLIKQFN